ncbi:hypothetical protein NDU88_004667 [Pleurodeles waltl]|uniref:Uncharacterized protein n=1 Tax=Pleurodeles waltl TaxID=8319 RepID=A0AAV7QCN6_PLEWA|nr:hypothetical protein NDU88_004667 [Pleurodeles waltl]
MRILQSFFRRIRLKKFFCSSPPPLVSNRSGLKPPSLFTPSLEAVGPEVAIFERVVVQRIEDMLRHIPKSKSNLFKEENVALRNLKENNEITVEPCDKGGGIAVLDTGLYIEKMSIMLQCAEFYITVPGNTENMIKRRIREMNRTALASELICQKVYDFLTPEYMRFPIIYGLSKAHKDLKDPPLRPIVSIIGSAIEPLSKYVDTFLKPLVAQLPSFVRDTGHFISKLEGLQYNPKQEILVTMELEALYTNIPQQQALDCVASYLDDLGADPLHVFILNCLEMILINNYFDFNGTIYQQIKGVSMGAACAPSVANLYVGAFEQRHIYNEIDPFFENVHLWC